MPVRTEFNFSQVITSPRKHTIRKVSTNSLEQASRMLNDGSPKRQLKSSVNLKSKLAPVSQSKGRNQVSTTGGI